MLIISNHVINQEIGLTHLRPILPILRKPVTWFAPQFWVLLDGRHWPQIGCGRMLKKLLSLICFSQCLWIIGKYRHCMKIVQIRIFFWSVFPRIRTEYRKIPRISLYSVRMQKNTDQKKLCISTLFTHWELFWPRFVKSP